MCVRIPTSNIACIQNYKKYIEKKKKGMCQKKWRWRREFCRQEIRLMSYFHFHPSLTKFIPLKSQLHKLSLFYNSSSLFRNKFHFSKSQFYKEFVLAFIEEEQLADIDQLPMPSWCRAIPCPRTRFILKPNRASGCADIEVQQCTTLYYSTWRASIKNVSSKDAYKQKYIARSVVYRNIS